jgi:hypothetical protein
VRTDGAAVELWCDGCAEVTVHVVDAEGSEAVCVSCGRVRHGPAWSPW